MVAVPMMMSLVCVTSLTLLSSSCLTSGSDWITEVDQRLPQLFFKTLGYRHL
jgi:hypothetical protein